MQLFPPCYLTHAVCIKEQIQESDAGASPSHQIAVWGGSDIYIGFKSV